MNHFPEIQKNRKQKKSSGKLGFLMIYELHQHLFLSFPYLFNDAASRREEIWFTFESKRK